MPRHDDDDRDYSEDSELGGPRYVQIKNGNGDLNKAMWAIAGTLAIALMGLGGVVASKVWDISERVARIEATVQYLVSKP